MTPTVGLIFDMDGVLIDSAEAHRRAWRALGDEVGLPFGDDLFARTFGRNNASIIPTWLGGTPSTDRIAELGDRKEELYRDLVRRGAIRVFAGAPERVRELRAIGARIAIASSGPRANIELAVAVLGLESAVDAIVSAEDVRHGKPDPEVFLRAAERIGVPPRQCAVIEDSLHGVQAARAAGMLAVATLTTEKEDILRRAGAEMVISEVGDLRPAELTGALCDR